MNQQDIAKEAKKWVAEQIITKDQYEKIIDQYPEKDKSFLLLLFSSLFIGLGFLTFVASNINGIPDYVNMMIILLFMIGYYMMGDHFYRKKSEKIGMSLIVIGLFIFGAGLFLTGQMYHYIYNNAVPFLIWSIAGLALYVVYKHPVLFGFTISIITVGQIYNGFVHQSFYWLLGLLFFAGCLHFVFHHPNKWYSRMFAISYLLQSLVLVLANGFEYQFFVILFLLLYLLGILLSKKEIASVFQSFSVMAVFILTCFDTFFLGGILEFTSVEWIYFYIWLPLFIFTIAFTVQKRIEELTTLVLFIPMIYAGTPGDYLSMLSLFIFSLGLLFSGYKQEDSRRIGFGTVSFLISTFVAYFHLAWAFLDKSLFFFIGGVLLFFMAYFLEKNRRSVKTKNNEVDKQ
ncbi:DUF2157 domain-containing protein [Gracilibacillus xinjiangensis]|uniref:DUF2157 domain-containing protein n=1 Tax=Gracilibacillus xinjiangensis TaxID=1193282 RepID=A0ABV8WX82_9BACI